MKVKITHNHTNKGLKAILMCCCIALFLQNLVAQNPNSNPNAQAPWKLNGSQADTTQFVGTTNNVDLIFKRNNIEGFRLLQDTATKFMGEVYLDKFKEIPPINSGPPKEVFLKVDNLGKITSTDKSGLLQSIYLQPATCLSTGTGVGIPVWAAKETPTYGILYTGIDCPARVGIGTNNPNSTLTVAGTGFFSSELSINASLSNKYQLNIETTLVKQAGIYLFNNHPTPITTPVYGIQNVVNNDNLIAYSVTKNTTKQDVFRVMGDGKVGIGMDNPLYPLDVFGAIHASGVIKNGGPDFILGIDDGRPQGTLLSQRALVHGDPNDELIINYGGDFEGGVHINGDKTIFDGNVGIGTTNPQAKLHVSGAGDQNIDISSTDSEGSYLRLMAVVSNNTTESQIQYKGKLRFVEPLSGTTRLMIDDDGITYAKELIVTITGFPDYVFAKNYQLKSLTEVEKFIKENNHLPDVPSEKEVKEKGINLGNMDALLLQKIEELTLYIIELEKRIKEVENK